MEKELKPPYSLFEIEQFLRKPAFFLYSSEKNVYSELNDFKKLLTFYKKNNNNKKVNALIEIFNKCVNVVYYPNYNDYHTSGYEYFVNMPQGLKDILQDRVKEINLLEVKQDNNLKDEIEELLK